MNLGKYVLTESEFLQQAAILQEEAFSALREGKRLKNWKRYLRPWPAVVRRLDAQYGFSGWENRTGRDLAAARREIYERWFQA